MGDISDIPYEDPECAAERQKALAAGDTSKYVLLAKGLSKTYGSHVALRSFCLTLTEGECFGLLGPNGAGKVRVPSCPPYDCFCRSLIIIIIWYSR